MDLLSGVAMEPRYAVAMEPVLGEEIAKDCRNRFEEIRGLLLAIIRRERGKTLN